MLSVLPVGVFAGVFAVLLSGCVSARHLELPRPGAALALALAPSCRLLPVPVLVC